MRKFLALVTLIVSGSACAQYKCVSPGGGVSFQQVPCAGATKGDKLVIKPAAGDAPASTAAPTGGGAAPPRENVDIRMVREMERERKIRTLRDDIAHAERATLVRAGQMEAELEALRQKKYYARQNLAGATWEQSISTEMTAVTQKHQNLNAIEVERIKAMRAELSRMEQGQ